MQFTLQPVAIAHTPFTEKFGIPRQAGLVPVKGEIELLSPFNRAEAVAGLESVSHIWLDFIFHQNPQRPEQLSVRPPRLGGNKKIGVFATRSSFRPNRLGTSLVALDDVLVDGSGVRLSVTGIDLLDQTPILDIKPYVPYVDSVPEATNAIADAAPEKRVRVIWSNDAEQNLANFDESVAKELKMQVEALIAFDPRPAYKQQQLGEYGMAFSGLNIVWRMESPVLATIERVTSLGE